MRNSILESSIVRLHHESHAPRSVSMIGHTLWRLLINTDQSNPGVVVLGGEASVLIRSARRPQGASRLPPRPPEIEPRCREAP
jgi:hypothetical protein